jgi:hypothetical protein
MSELCAAPHPVPLYRGVIMTFTGAICGCERTPSASRSGQAAGFGPSRRSGASRTFAIGERKQSEAHNRVRRSGTPGAAGAVAFRLAGIGRSVGAMAVGARKVPASRRAFTEGWGVYSRMYAEVQFVPANIRAGLAVANGRAADIPGRYGIIPGLPAMIAGLPGIIPGTPGMIADRY